MGSIGSSVRRGGTFATVVLAGLLLVATACGGGSKSSSSSSDSSSSNGSTATTASSGSSGGSSMAGCLELASKFDEALSKATSSMTNSSGNVDWNGIASGLDSMTSSMPSKIRDDWKTYVEAVKKLATAMNGVDMSQMMSNPATAQKFADAMSTFDDAKYKTAVDNITAYFDQKCPGM